MHACRGTWGCSCSCSCLTLLAPDSYSDPDPDPTHGVVARERKRKSLRLRLRSALLTQSRSQSVSFPLTITLSHHRLRSIINGATHILQLTSPHPPILPSFHPHPPIPILPMLHAPCPERSPGHWALGTPLRLKQLNFQLFVNKRMICLSSLQSAVPGPEARPLRIAKPAFALAACKFLSHIFYH